jgi:Prealbumin-like fold domain
VTLLASLGVAAAVHAATPFASGDVMAGVGSGSVKQFSPTGTLKNTLVGSAATYTSGMAFDHAGNLYVTGFSSGKVDKYNTNGTFLGAFITGLTGDPESLSFDSTGNLYVGQADGTHHVLKYSSTGALLGSFTVTTEARGSDWIDLAADQCTLFYTSEGVLIKRFNVCTNTQLANFATLPSGSAYALRIRPNGEVIVAATSHAYRLSSTGTLLKTYTVPGSTQLFGMNLDPDGTSFWTGDLSGGDINRIDIASGTVLKKFNSSPLTALGGLAVVGELRAASSAHLTLAKSINNTGGGTALATAWTLSATGPTPISGHTGDSAITNAQVTAGTYTLAEAGGPVGYTAGAWLCTGGTLTGSRLVLAAGATASCSITNTFAPNRPSVSTHLSASSVLVGTSVHDTATLTGVTSDAGGTITYAVYNNNTCTALVADLTPTNNTVVNRGVPDSKALTFTAAGNFWFQAVYSGDAKNVGPVKSPCVSEPLAVRTPSPTPVVTPSPTPVVTPSPTPVVTPSPTPVVMLPQTDTTSPTGGSNGSPIALLLTALGLAAASVLVIASLPVSKRKVR